MLTREELKANKNNVMTIMENRVMSMTGCDRKTANLVANEVLNLDRDAEWLLNNEEELNYNIWCENLSFEDWKNKYENDSEKMKKLYDESHLWVRQNYQKGDECFVIIKYNEQEKNKVINTYLFVT